MALKYLNFLDNKLSQKIRLPESRTGLRRAAALFAHSADSWFWLAGLIPLYFFAPAPRKPLIIKLIIGTILTAAFVLTLKKTIQRPRPEGEWGQIYRSTDPHSFPSGHAARAIMLSTIILLSGQAWIGLAMVIWSLMVSLARIALGVHYLLDILIGLLIGIVFGLGVTLGLN